MWQADARTPIHATKHEIVERNRKMATAKRDAEKLIYRGYVVAVVDILGQRNAIRALAKVRPTERNKPEIIQELKKSLGVRDGVRKQIQNLFDNLTRKHEMPQAYSVLNDAQRALFDRMRPHAVKTYGFGDTFVAYTPVVTVQGDPSIIDIHVVLTACALSVLFGIAAGNPVRGAIELEFGIEPAENEIYGPAFLAPFDLQEVVAQHPRIIVGDELRGYLGDIGAHPKPPPLGSAVATLARDCGQLIARDEDGCFILDYLGEKLRQVVSDASEAHDLFERGLQFARREQRRFVEERNPKLAARYAAVVRYFDSRSALWSNEGD